MPNGPCTHQRCVDLLSCETPTLAVPHDPRGQEGWVGGVGTIDRLSYHWFSEPLFSWHVWEHLKRAFCMKRKHDPSHSPLTNDHSGVLGLGRIIQLYGSCIQEIFCNTFWLPVYGFDQSDMFWLVSCNCHLSVTISTQHSLSTSMSIRFWQDHWKTIL